jgi:glycosyltransferase involved in cell wall biosynthesis
MNVAACDALSEIAPIYYIGPISPPIYFYEKVTSHLLRTAGLPRNFLAFSARRLKVFAEEVSSQCVTDARLDFFHGFTGWILAPPPRPYVAYSDCTFHDYMNIYHRRELFRVVDLERIERAEAAWLKRAHRVLFSTQWAAERAVNTYGLDVANVKTIGAFGESDMPVNDTYAGAKEFAFVSTNFFTKGGHTVFSAFRALRAYHPDARLTVVGDCPASIASQAGVEFVGFLRKEVPAEYAMYRQILGRVRALVHPTSSDIAPLIIIEAGYFGCPAISSRRFAIPEIVDDMRTGLLLDEPTMAVAVERAMDWMLRNEHEYQEMRRAVWTKARKEHCKSRFSDQLCTAVCSTMNDGWTGAAQ